MPNHISNKLTLNCEAATAIKIISEIGGKYDDGSDRPIDFDKILPYPTAFAEADSACEQWRLANPDRPWNEVPKDGYNSGGYEWCVANWGTKWNAYSQERLGDTEIYFETAWSTAVPIYDLLSKKYPELNFTVEYADEDNWQ